MSFLTQRVVISVEWETAIARRVVAFVRDAWSRRPRRAREAERPARPDRERATAYLDELEARYALVPEPAVPGGFEAFEILLVDGSAFVALEGGDVAARAHLRAALNVGATIVVAASSLADPRVAAVAERVAIVIDVDDRIGKEAARLVTETRRDFPIDALTVACAPTGMRVAILTADPAGLGAFVRATGRTDLVLVSVAAHSPVGYSVSTMPLPTTGS